MYDANGNLYAENVTKNGVAQNGDSKTFTYTSFNMTAQIHEPAKLLVHTARDVTFQYGPEHQRIRQDGAGGVSTIYLNPANGAGLFYEKDLLTLGRAEQRYFVNANGRAVALIKKSKSGLTTSTQYLHYDALGSVVAVTNSLRTVQDQLAYEPFGKRRELNGKADVNDSLEGKETDRGFTGHEHLEEFQLVNMNGRIYSPVMGRFLSADPNIADPNDPQSYNRYSYVRNNPLGYTDPSGYFHISLHRVGRELKRWEHDFRHELRNPNSLLGPALRIVAAGGCALAGGGVACVSAGEYAISKYQGVSDRNALRNAVIAGATAYVFEQVGEQFPIKGQGANVPGNLLAHAAVGCAAAAASHANCGRGAAAAFIGDGAGMLGQDNFALGLALSTAGGGIGSVITGGKFGDGAVTAAFGYLFGNFTDQVRNGVNPANAMLDTLGKIWALPNTVIGLTAGIISLPFGTSVSIANNAIAFTNFPWGPGGAITFGNVIISTTSTLDELVPTYAAAARGGIFNSSDYVRIGNHEEGHTYQYQALGPLFLPVYGLSGGISPQNSLESAADRYGQTGKGWWP